jgi:hypothetical protein
MSDEVLQSSISVLITLIVANQTLRPSKVFFFSSFFFFSSESQLHHTLSIGHASLTGRNN